MSVGRIFNESDHVIFIAPESSAVSYTAPDPSVEDNYYRQVTGSYEIPYPEPNREREATASELGRNKDRLSNGSVDINAGTITSKIVDGRVFSWVLGSESYDSTNYVHTIDTKDENPPQTFTLQLLGRRGSSNDQNIVAVGSVPDTATFTFGNDGSAEASIDWLATQVTDEPTAIDPSNVIDVSKPTAFSWVDRTKQVNVGGRTWGTVEELELEVDNNVQLDYDWDDPNNLYDLYQPRKIRYGNTTITGTVTAKVDESSFIQRVTGSGTTFDSSFEFEKDDGTVLRIDAINGVIQNAPYEIPEDDAVTTDIEIEYERLEVTVEEPSDNGSFL